MAGRNKKYGDTIGTDLHLLNRDVILLRNISKGSSRTPLLYLALQHVSPVLGRPDQVVESICRRHGVCVAGPMPPLLTLQADLGSGHRAHCQDRLFPPAASSGAAQAFSRIRFRIEPIATLVRLEIGLILKKRATWRVEMVPTMPRLRASSASSRGVQWLIGRPDASGGSQARAMIWHHCSALKVAGAPGRGASWRRSGTAQPGRVSQWRRQRRTVVRVVPRRRATSGAVRPSANREDHVGSEAQVLGRLMGTDHRVERLTLLL